MSWTLFGEREREIIALAQLVREISEFWYGEIKGNIKTNE
jgi:hypothetical protein